VDVGTLVRSHFIETCKKGYRERNNLPEARMSLDRSATPWGVILLHRQRDSRKKGKALIEDGRKRTRAQPEKKRNAASPTLFIR